MPADLERLHKQLLKFKHIDAVSHEMRMAGTGAQAAAKAHWMDDAALLLKRASASSHPQVRTFIERWGSAMPVLPVDLNPLVLRAASGRRLHLLDERAVVQVPAKTPLFSGDWFGRAQAASSTSWSILP